MPNRFPGKACVLCPQPSTGVGEHVIPSWYQGEFLGDAPFKSENAGRAYLNRQGDLAVQQSLPGTHVPMSSDCNGRWSGQTRRIELPGYIRVGDRELRFMRREFGIRGLDAT